MWFEVGHKIFAREADESLFEWCKEKLELQNPDFVKKERMGLWTGNVPRKICLYEQNGNDLVLPFGCVAELKALYPQCRFKSRISPVRAFNFGSDINLYPYQEVAVNEAIIKRNGIIVMPCGAGKTQTALEIVSRLGYKTLWLTHTQDLLNQSLNRAKSVLTCANSSYGAITGGKVKIGSGLTFATVQTMAKLDLSQYRDEWGCVIVDECMPGDTKIATPYGFKLLKNLCNGDIVTSYNRNIGKVESKKVIHTFKNKAHNIVNVNLSNGEKITCTGNHPIFTKQGWIDAERLESDDYVMRMVWEAGRDRQYAKHKQTQSVGERMVLLLKRMFCERRSQEGCLDGRAQEKSIRTYEEDKRRVSFTDHGKNDEKQPYEKSLYKSESIKAVKRNWASSKDKMRKWSGVDSSATKFCDKISRFCGCIYGISYTNKNVARQWLSNLLQSRHSNSGENDCNRNRRRISLHNSTAGAGQEKRCVFEWVRVESVEIQKQTSDGTFGRMCCDGYVYNIEVEDNNNYFADGYLVHNCHKAVGSPTKVMQFYRVLSALSCRYKFGITATPRRADGLHRSMLALLGGIIYEVGREEIKDTVCKVVVQKVETGYMPDIDIVLAGDGTINYAGLVDDMIHNENRFEVVMSSLASIQIGQPVLVLANRVEYLQRLCTAYRERQIGEAICLSAMGNSKGAKQARKQALNALNTGELDCVFSTYALAREGLDVPRLRYVVFATPEKDPTTIEQSTGRVGRKADGKPYGTVIDFVDNFGMYKGWWKKRLSVYKKIGCDIIE